MRIKSKNKSLIFSPDTDGECYQLGSFFRDIPHTVTFTDGKLVEVKTSFFNLWHNVMPIAKEKMKK